MAGPWSPERRLRCDLCGVEAGDPHWRGRPAKVRRLRLVAPEQVSPAGFVNAWSGWIAICEHCHYLTNRRKAAA